MPLTGKGTKPRRGLRRRTDRATGERLFAALVVASLALITLGARSQTAGFFTGLRNGFSVITAPVRYAGSLVVRPFGAAGNIIVNLTTDQATLSELQEENRQLRARNAELEEAALSTERYESLLGLSSAYSLSTTGARIISGSTDSWTATVTIDKGLGSGISVGMPVTDGVGVIGQVIECGPTSAVVRLITDENSGVSAMVQSSRAQGVLKGTVTGSLRLTLIGTDKVVNVGDNVITSGLGGVFPKGLPLGKVMSVEGAQGALYYEIVVEPLSSPESLEEVLVITSISSEQQATAEEIAEADEQETSNLTNDDALDPFEVPTGDDGQGGAEGSDDGNQDDGEA